MYQRWKTIEKLLVLKTTYQLFTLTSSVHLRRSLVSNHLDSYHCHHHCLLSGLLVVHLNRQGRFLLLVWEDQINLAIVLLRLGLTWVQLFQETLKSQTKNSNWTQLCSLYIKTLNPALSVGIKATEELNIFRYDLMFSSLYFRLIWLFTSTSSLPNTFVLFSNKQLFVFCKLIKFLFVLDDGSE